MKRNYKKKSESSRYCKICGNIFFSYRKTQIFCSNQCRWRDHKRLMNCLTCGNEFFSKVKMQKFCSKTCQYKSKENREKHKILRKKYYEINGEILREKARKKSMIRIREKLKLPIDTPRLKRNFGEGTYQDGYKFITKHGHPNSHKSRKGKLAEHIYIMSEYLGRPLRKGENVHHKNGIRDDNRIENLELWEVRQPPGQRVEDKIEWAIEFLEEYGYQVIKKE